MRLRCPVVQVEVSREADGRDSVLSLPNRVELELLIVEILLNLYI